MGTEIHRTLSLVAVDAKQRRLAVAVGGRAGWRVQEEAPEPSAILVGRWDDAQEAFVRATRADNAGLPILVCADLDASIPAMRAGASDFLRAPLTRERLVMALETAADRRRRGSELRPLAEKIVKPLAFDEIVGSTPAFRAALAVAAKAARSRVSVLIEGERGTGKETIARAIHGAGPRASRPMLSIDCGTHSPAQLEAALFGYEKGAFASAFTSHAGMLEEASGATLFLDGIEHLTPELQLRLLQVLDTGEVTRLGGRGFKAIDLRLIAACGGRISDATAAGRFREDLAARLAVHIWLPPLRERRSDIPPLTRHFLGLFADQPGLPQLGITDDALTLLINFGWAGNVREMQTALFRAALHCQGHALTAADFPQIARESAHGKRADDYHARQPEHRTELASLAHAPGVTLYLPDGNLRPLEDIEADVIRLAIGHYQGRMSEVARRLGIGRSTLYRKLAELGISDAAA